MKNIIYLFILMFYLPLSSKAQNDSILINAYYAQQAGKIYLRWAPSEQFFTYAMQNGFTLVRYTSDPQNENYTFEDFIASKVVLIEQSSLTVSSEKAQKAHTIINAQVQDSISNDRNFNDAVKYTQNKASQYFYTMLLAEGDFNTAVDLGLGFVDENVEEGKTYIYEVELYNYPSVTKVLASVSIKANKINEPTRFESTLNAKGDNLAAILSWDIKSIEDKYSSYLIYRSTNEYTYECINCNDPFFPMNDSEESRDIVFMDGLADNSTTYYYKIRGKDAFGFLSDYSNTVTVKGTPPSLNFELKMEPMTFNPTNLILNWSLSVPSVSSNLKGFNVYRLLDISGKAEKLNTQLISKNIFNFTISNPVSAAYYYIEAIDNNDRKYQTIAVLGQPTDITPPNKPIGLNGFISRTGDATIKWTPNNETDLDGYLVFYSNERSGPYSQLTTANIASPNYNTVINAAFSMDSIFFKVAAVDKRFNKSLYSDALALQRPDITAPSIPLITQLLGMQDGIHIGWSLPSAKDLKDIVLQRKVSSGSNWKTILYVDYKSNPSLPLVTGELVNSNFIDTATLQPRAYDYRLVATDNSQNMAISEVETVKPYDNGRRGAINNYNLVLSQYELKYLDIDGHTLNIADGIDITLPTDPLGNNNGGQIGGGSTVNTTIQDSKKAVRLSWKYDTTFPKSLYSFNVYRESPVVYSSDAINTTPEWLLVKTMTPTRAARNATFFKTDGYIWFDTTVQPLKSGKYRYKIIAEHIDGGFSMWSQILEITYN
jgi:uncharacterized protein